MKKSLIAILMVILWLPSLATAKQMDSKQFIQSIYDQSMVLNKNHTKTHKKDTEKFIRNNFAVKSISYFVLGSVARKVNKEQFAEFSENIVDMLSIVVREKLSEIHPTSFKILGTMHRGKSTFVSSVLTTNDSKFTIDWRIKPTKNTASYVVQDIILEGISVSKSYRDKNKKILTQVHNDIPKFLAIKKKEAIALSKNKGFQKS